MELELATINHGYIPDHPTSTKSPGKGKKVINVIGRGYILLIRLALSEEIILNRSVIICYSHLS